MLRSKAPSTLLGLTGILACSLFAGSAAADDETYDFKKEKGTEHGSQVASSEWLPIMIGGAAGVMIGGLSGVAFDDSQPAVIGPIVGGVLGGASGGAAGAWIIRSVREKDTRTAGLITGLGIGGGIGAVLFTKMEPDGRALETIGKYGALVIAPVIGAVAGHQLASYFQSKPPKAKEPMPVAFAPSVAPVVGPHGASGFTFGLDGAF